MPPISLIYICSQTGDRETRNAIFETVLTKPEPVTSLTMEDIQTGTQIHRVRETSERANGKKNEYGTK
jgi:hypothetical protein